MQILASVLLACTLVLCGAYAGLVLMCHIAVLPAMRKLSPNAYADAWRAMDSFMARYMPPYKATLLLLNAAALLLLLKQHQAPLAVAIGLSLLFSVAGLLLTVRGQLHINALLNTLPAGAPDATLLQLRDRTIRGFRIRFALSLASFVVLCVGVVFWPIH